MAFQQQRNGQRRVRHLRAGVAATPGAVALTNDLEAVNRELEEVAVRLVGDAVREKLAEPAVPSISEAVDRVVSTQWSTTSAPTQTQRASIERAGGAFEATVRELDGVAVRLSELSRALDASGGPWTPR